ncbi:MAG: PASTA domain-containing protein [Myxococcales bacterium]|nr:PASTA domain-containing protein [Myxococcales bacterium]
MKAPVDTRLRWLRARVAFLAFLLLSGGVLVARRAYELQVEHDDTLREMAEDQYLKNVHLSPKRGTIYDRNGAPLAVSVGVESVYANPRVMRRAQVPVDRAARDVAVTLGVDFETMRKRFAQDRAFVWIKRQVTPSEANAVRKLGIKGIELTHEAKRFYPNRELASHVIGMTNIDGKGLEGVERSLDERLTGATHTIPAIRDNRGQIVFSEKLLDDRTALGDDVILTLDKTLQSVTERELELGVRTFEAQAGSVVMIDPSNGEVLALANFPTFNPNDPSHFSAAARRNRAVTDRYEPGSTLKPFTVAAAIDRRTIRSDQAIDCGDGQMQVAEYTIHDTHHWSVLTPAQVLAQSSNIGAAKIGATLGREGLYRALRNFGFGEKTGVLLPGETAGILRHYRRWYEMDAATIAFGQGMSVNTLQLAVATAAIANGGRLLHPVLVKRLNLPDGGTELVDPPETRHRVVGGGTARLVTDMLTAVTSSNGTGSEAAVDGFLVAGKTGTAQKHDYIGGGYADGKWVSSFVGYLPAEKPRLVIAVMIDEPTIAHYGGSVAGPVFRRIAEASLRHLGVAPRHAPDLRRTKLTRSRPATEHAKAAPTTEGPVVTESAPVGVGRTVVPSFEGMTLRAALAAARARGLEPSVDGSGVARAQQPAAGAVVDAGTRVRIRFEPPHDVAGDVHGVDVSGGTAAMASSTGGVAP